MLLLYGIVQAWLLYMKKMRQIYTLAFYFTLPFILIRLLVRSRQDIAYRQRLKERFGRPGFANLQHSIWIHAVSYGEVVAAEPLIRNLRKRYPERKLVITTMTITGSRRVQQTFPDIYHCYVPYDIPYALRHFLGHVMPSLLIIMETELWPNMLYYAVKNHIPILLANARLSAKSLAGYKRLPHSIKASLLAIDKVLVQSAQDAKRFEALGLPQSALNVAGNLKFSVDVPTDMVAEGKRIRKTWQHVKHVIIAASTHPTEELQILDVMSRLLKNFSQLLLILVPRHPQRFDEVAKLCSSHQFVVARRCDGFAIASDTQVFIGDSMGEMYLYYALADIAFVGGSLVPMGGHNLLEPAMLRLPVLSGPNVTNFVEISDMLVKSGMLTLVKNKEELFQCLRRFLLDQNHNEVLLQKNDFVSHGEHVLQQHLNTVDELLNKNLLRA